MAAWKGHREVVEWALLDEEGPRLTQQLFVRDLDGRSLLDLCVMAGHEELHTWLNELMVKLKPHDTDNTDDNGGNAAYCVSSVVGCGG